jgi:CheY-like chemotaxis protein
MAKIFVIEDDRTITELLQIALRHEGHEVCLESLGRLDAIDDTYDLVLLDLSLPEAEGLELARRIRAAYDVPIIMVTARGALGDKVAGFDAGADDYITKPFSFEELSARVRAVLPRTGDRTRENRDRHLRGPPPRPHRPAGRPWPARLRADPRHRDRPAQDPGPGGERPPPRTPAGPGRRLIGRRTARAPFEPNLIVTLPLRPVRALSSACVMMRIGTRRRRHRRVNPQQLLEVRTCSRC